MDNAPIPAVLALWQAGYSGAWIADKLGFPDEKHIQRIVAHGRELNDPRALVIHVDANGRPIGKENAIRRLRERFPKIKTVLIQDRQVTREGPPQIEEHTQ